MAQDDYDALQRRIKKYEANRAANIDNALRELASISKGRDLIWWLLAEAGVGTIPFNPDPYRTAFNCGELNQGQKLLARLTDVAPQAYVTMMKENSDARAALERNTSNEPDTARPSVDGNPGSFD